MANTTISPNMNLPIPVVGVDAGPDYANNVNASLTIIDQHSHVAGSGVQITPAAININANLAMNDNALVSTEAVTFTPQSVAPSNDSVYVSGVDLYFVDGNGNNIQVTSGGSVNATSSGISSGTATASFVGGVLVVDANVNTPANIQGASLLMGNNVANSNYLTLSPPSALAANYSIVLPTLPAQTNVVTLDSSGNMGSITYDAVGQDMTSVGADAVAASRTRSTGTSVGIGGVAISNSCGSYQVTSSPATVTNLSVGITTSGRPVQLFIQPDGSSSNTSTFQGSTRINLVFYRDSTLIAETQLDNGSSAVIFYFGFANFIDTPAAGTYTYSVQASGSTSSFIKFMRLVAYEV